MPLSEEHKAKMKAGRERAAAERKAKGEKIRRPRASGAREPGSSAAREPGNRGSGQRVEPREFLGITKTACPVECTVERCVITQSQFCGHPCKGAMQPALMANRETVERYDRARKFLAHVELDKRP